MLITADYWGIGVVPNGGGDVWFGGLARTTYFKFSKGYWDAMADSEGNRSNRLDIWADRVGEPEQPTPAERVDDLVSGIAVTPQGNVWIGSHAHGLAVLSGSGVGYLKNELVSANVAAVTMDSRDGSIWTGHRWGGGLSRVRGGTVAQYSYGVFGSQLGDLPTLDVQMMGSGASRKVLVAFLGNGSMRGAIGIYSGD